MSIGNTNARLTQHPPVGRLKERFTVDLGVSELVTGSAEDATEAATHRAVARIYGDIAADFEKLLTMICRNDEIPEDAAVLIELIRASFRGSRPGTMHSNSTK